MSHEDIPTLKVNRVFLLVPEVGRFVEESRMGTNFAYSRAANTGYPPGT
jgi:hypothetical protein